MIRDCDQPLRENETRLIPKGSFVVLTGGEYSSYTLGPVAQATCDIEINIKDASNPGSHSPSWAQHQADLLKSGALKEMDYYEWHDESDRAVFTRGEL